MYALIIILFCELFHLIIHILVLFKLFSIKSFTLLHRKLYFSFDMISVLSSFLIIRKYFWLVLIHFIIHISAITYLYNMPSMFKKYINNFKDVFELAEQNWDKNNSIKIKYILGTLEDIIVHFLNVYSLLYLYKF
jgi:hypothetical protein